MSLTTSAFGRPTTAGLLASIFFTSGCDFAATHAHAPAAQEDLSNIVSSDVKRVMSTDWQELLDHPRRVAGWAERMGMPPVSPYEEPSKLPPPSYVGTFTAFEFPPTGDGSTNAIELTEIGARPDALVELDLSLFLTSRSLRPVARNKFKQLAKHLVADNGLSGWTIISRAIDADKAGEYPLGNAVLTVRQNEISAFPGGEQLTLIFHRPGAKLSEE